MPRWVDVPIIRLIKRQHQRPRSHRHPPFIGAGANLHRGNKRERKLNDIASTPNAANLEVGAGFGLEASIDHGHAGITAPARDPNAKLKFHLSLRIHLDAAQPSVDAPATQETNTRNATACFMAFRSAGNLSGMHRPFNLEAAPAGGDEGRCCWSSGHKQDNRSPHAQLIHPGRTDSGSAHDLPRRSGRPTPNRGSQHRV